MKKNCIITGLLAAGLLLSAAAEAGPWKSLTEIQARSQKLGALPTLHLAPGACFQNSDCRAGSPYCWSGHCLACTHPMVTEALRDTGYVRCDEGFCTNSGAAALASIFGGAGEFQVVDCSSVPPAPSRESAQATHFGLGTDDYTIGTIAVPYEGQQIGAIHCDPGEVAVSMKARADTIVRSVTGLDCKPINRLSFADYHSKTPSAPLGGLSGTEASQIAANGSALVGFDARYANTLEYDNRLGNLAVLSPARLDASTGVANNEMTAPGEDRGFSVYGTYESTNSPWIRTMCPKKFIMTGVQVLYDSDSVKSVTPTCRRVYAPGEAPATVPEGRYGLGKGSEVGYLGGRTVSNAAVVGSPVESGDDKCPEGSVMTGWHIGSLSSFGNSVSLHDIHCQNINSIIGNCNDASPPLVSDLDLNHNNDLGRQGCAMVGFQYKQQKQNEAIYSLGVDYPTDNQAISELHSILASRDQTQSGLQGPNVGLGSNALNCWPHTTYNCNTTDWIDVRCPGGSFMVGVKRIEAGLGLANLGAYCREAVESPWREGTEPAPEPAALRLAPGVLNSPALLRPLAPTP